MPFYVEAKKSPGIESNLIKKKKEKNKNLWKDYLGNKNNKKRPEINTQPYFYEKDTSHLLTVISNLCVLKWEDCFPLIIYFN